MISTIIAKPTKYCNAHCTYCSSPQSDDKKWTNEQFEMLFDKVAPKLTDQAVIIWHGGEPMTMGTEFYYRAYEYATKRMPNIKFAMQSNILLYKSKIWKDIFVNMMQGRISTSFDPDERFRIITPNGTPRAYSKLFFDKLDNVIDDGVMPMIIGTYGEESIPYAKSIYQKSLEKDVNDKSFNIRFNYRYPAGRAFKEGELISPKSYGKMLTDLFDQWIDDAPNFCITPLDQMLRAVIRNEKYQEVSMRCPWTNKCGGKFLGIEPTGDVYNCGDFADLEDPQYLFGNIFSDDSVDEILGSKAAVMIRRRHFDLPSDCFSCEFFKECGGGCARDAVLYNRGMGGKFYYCESWKTVFRHIKKAYREGRADNILHMIPK